MLSPEYRVGFRVLKEKIGLWSTLRIAFSALLKSSSVNHKVSKSADETERTKADLKNHFKLLAFMYKELEKRYAKDRSDQIMREVLFEGGEVFFRGFTRLGPDNGLLDFVPVYKNFEKKQHHI